MESWEQDCNGPGEPRETWAWAVLGSLVVHGLVVGIMLSVLQDKPGPRRVVVPVEAIALVPFKPGPAGGGGGRGTGSGGGVGQGQGPGSGAGSALQGYLKEVRRLLEKHKDYPHMARRRQLQGIVVMVFTISSGGQIESYRVGRASGHDLLDEAAKETIRRVGHFPPFPADLNRQKLTIEIPLAFRLSTD